MEMNEENFEERWDRVWNNYLEMLEEIKDE